MPTLVVVRHAKADRPIAVEDFGRPLLPRGREDAKAAGEWLAGAVGKPGLIVSSPARRTAETVEGLISPYGTDVPPIVYEESLYEASLGDMLRVVRGLDDDAGLTVLVGHNPSVSELVSELTGQPTELRTTGIAVIEVPSAWADTPSSSCRLVRAETPRA
ncbi:SixA phosphatase family protein [Motilibacter aurantiacus]|uniref:SixA phosphatase family protein n=1 Tax=Motilibacter aurantiacus TaxID=2714955 RepID=UPI00140CAC98|nr:histidine phosphatase family protein [Motilibacter aurantiacus]NHC45408.1 histidine phosphatase family protein [Motilibacter aurantiacus]